MKFELPVIDSHIHITDWYNNETGKTFITRVTEAMDNTGMDGINIASLADKLYGGTDINIMCAICKLEDSRTYSYANFYFPEYPVVPPLPEGLDSLTQYNEFMNIGFDGIKLLYKPDVQKLIKLKINDAYYEPFFAQAEKDGTNILWHVADPKYCWDEDYDGYWAYKDGTYPAFEEMFDEVFDVLKKHPKLNVTFAHFFFLAQEPERLEKLFSTYENVRIDVTPHPMMYVYFNERPEYYREFFKKYSDRILFGTDIEFPMNDDEKQIEAVYTALTEDKEFDLLGVHTKGLGLSDDICKKIFKDNFLKACDVKPKDINMDALVKYVNKYSKYIEKDVHKKCIKEYFTQKGFVVK